MLDVNWMALALFAAAALLLALYGLAVSGHFPAEFRDASLRGAFGGAMLWSTIALALFSAGATLARGAELLPWYAMVIAAGAAVLFAPLLLRPLPDSFVNRRVGLLSLSLAATLVTATLWRAG